MNDSNELRDTNAKKDEINYDRYDTTVKWDGKMIRKVI